MKYLIITSLYTSIIAVTTTQSELFPILFSTAGILAEFNLQMQQNSD